MRYQIHVLLEGGQSIVSKVCETGGSIQDASREVDSKLGGDRFTIEDEGGSLITIRSQYVMAASVARVIGGDEPSSRFAGVKVVTAQGDTFRCYNTTHYHGPLFQGQPCPQCLLVTL